MPIFPPDPEGVPPTPGEWPDLSRARTVIERLMIDEVRFWFQPEGGTMDEGTAEIERPDPITLYAGKGKVRRERSRSTDREEGEANTNLIRCTVGIPIGSNQIPAGAYCSVVSSVRDPGLAGRDYLVISVPGNTFAVQQAVECEEAKIVDKVRP